MKNLVAGAFMAGALAFVSFAVYTQAKPAPLTDEQLDLAQAEMMWKAMGLDPVVMRQVYEREKREEPAKWRESRATVVSELAKCNRPDALHSPKLDEICDWFRQREQVTRMCCKLPS